MKSIDVNETSVLEISKKILDFIGISTLKRASPAYQRKQDFDRVWGGFTELLVECAKEGKNWSEVLDRFEGFGQIMLMTIHKCKGLEFHSIIFCGLDNKTWWSLTPNKIEELNTFFVAFTRAKQRAFFTLSKDRGAPVTWIENLLAPAGVRHINGPI